MVSDLNKNVSGLTDLVEKKLKNSLMEPYMYNSSQENLRIPEFHLKNYMLMMICM